MSLRTLKKLKGDSNILVPELQEKLSEDEGSSATEEEPQIKPTGKKKKKNVPVVINPFDLLNDEEVNGKVSDENEELEEKEETSDTTNQIAPQPPVVGARKKKKKKKKKSKEKSQENGEVEKKTASVEDEIDASIREVNALLGELPINPALQSPASDHTAPLDTKSLLAVEHKYLSADNEMRRIFGSQVVQAERSNVNRRRHRVAHKKTWLTQHKDTWPQMSKTGLSMSSVETRSDGQYFAFEHSQPYRKIQYAFWEAVDSMDPQNIAQVLTLQPYHIDSLLQLSDVCRMSDDTAMATDLIERALYSCESSFHPCFNLAQGNCRLEYRIWENRSFHLALFKHLIYVGLRGCYRTALEFCKLLLSLAPEEDPLCASLMIDFYAIKAQEYKFLIRLYHEWEPQKNMSLLPNFAMSVPLAMFHIALEEGQDTEQADLMLQNGLLRFPGVLMPLLDKCGINPDKQVSSHAYFSAQAQLSQPDALKQLIAVYVGRCFACWKEPEVVTWLERNVRDVMTRVDQNDPLVEEFTKKRKTCYVGTPHCIYRHIILSEIKDATAALPPDLASSPVMSYDPLPPTDSTYTYTRPERRTRAQQSTSALTAFFQSLLPNYNPQEVVEEPEGAAGGAAAGNDLRQGIGQLMEAMRDLLNNIQPAPPPRDDGEQDGEGEGHEPPEEFD